MSVVAMFSDKGSPGVTTLGLMLATVWPRPVALVEADPAGGDLARRLTDGSGHPILAIEPNVLTLAAAARRDPDAQPPLVWTHSQRLPSGGGRAHVVPGLATPEQATAMTDLWHPLVSSFATADCDVLLDLGRISNEGIARQAIDQADVVVAVARADAAGMIRLRDRLRHLAPTAPTGAPRQLIVGLVAEDRHAGEAVAAMRRVLQDGFVRAEVAGTIALDPAAVAVLLHSPGDSRLDRSLLLRSARQLAARISGQTELPGPASRRRLLARAR